MPIRCEIVSQDRVVYQGDADMVLLPGTDGEMGILPHHAPLLTTLKYGIIKVRSKGQESIFTVAGGIAEVQEVGDRIEDGDGLNRAAFAVNRVGGVGIAGATSRRQH